MALSFCVLGSGSAGNCTMVQLGGGDQPKYILIDIGLSPRATAKRLAPLGINLDQISAVLLTHFDTDHFYSGWLKVIERRKLPVYVHQQHRRMAWKSGLSMKFAQLFTRTIKLNDSADISSVLLAHDDLGSVGYVIEHAGFRLGYATDLGRVPKNLFDHFTNLDALAIESNYDVKMQLTSGRPRFLKQRIMGGSGHLSNDQSLEAVHQIAENCGLSHIALLHLSRQCNDPELVRRLYEEQAPHLLDRLTITNQHEPSSLLNVKRGKPVQQAMFRRPTAQMTLFESHVQPGNLVPA